MLIYVVISFFVSFANANPFYYECQNSVLVQNEDLGQARAQIYMLCLKTLKTQGIKGFDLHSRCQNSNIKCTARARAEVDRYSCELLAQTMEQNPDLIIDDEVKKLCSP